MKKLFLILLIVFTTSTAYAAGTITGVLTRAQTAQGRPVVTKLVLTCTGDSSNGGYPATTLSQFFVDASGRTYVMPGLQLYSVKVIPGTTGPTADSDMTITDEYGVDLLGGKGTNLIKNAAKTWALFGPSGYYISPIVTGELTLTITGNSVNSATITIVIEFIGV